MMFQVIYDNETELTFDTISNRKLFKMKIKNGRETQ